jgi:tight adherence protein C
MSQLAGVILLSVLGTAGLLLLVSGWVQPAPTLERVIARLQRPAPSPGSGTAGLTGRIIPVLARCLGNHPRFLPDDTVLRVVGRPVEQHVLLLVLAALGGGLLPFAAFGALQSAGFLPLGWFVPSAAALLGVAVGPLIVHTATVERASELRSDLRYQASAYLDVVTMLLAGNTGYEGALEQAARAGDGRLFGELRRRMRESGARGASLTEAIDRAGRELGIDELEQVAATAALSAAEGAPVARTLAAKCATLRAALSSEQESEARLRTSRLTTPIVGMALIFMALVIYPALTFS